jgi:dTDP-glucose 4,6-dehydratase
MKLLITGGAGFIGSNFVHYWIKNYPQDELVVLDNLTYAGNLENLELVKDKFVFLKGDICVEAMADKAMQGIDIVVHFAAESHNDRAIMDPGIFVKTNVLGTQNLLNAARKNGVKRFHHISTDEVFGEIPLSSKEKWTEDTPYNPRSPYSASKAGSDHLVRAYGHTYELPITITNCTNNFGPYMFPEKFLPLAITNLLENKKIPIYGNGQQVRDWLYVDDHAAAIDLVLQKGSIGSTYLIGSEHREYTNLEVAKILLKIMGKDESFLEFVKDRPGHDQKYAVDASKIRTELGWRPEHEFEQWLESTVDWYKNNEAWWKRVKSREYQKYYQEQYNNR